MTATTPAPFTYDAPEGVLTFEPTRDSLDGPALLHVSGTLTLHRVEYRATLDLTGEPTSADEGEQLHIARDWDKPYPSDAASKRARAIGRDAMAAYVQHIDLPGEEFEAAADAGYAADLLHRHSPTEYRSGLFALDPDKTLTAVNALVQYHHERDTVVRLRSGLPIREAARPVSAVAPAVAAHLAAVVEFAVAPEDERWEAMTDARYAQSLGYLAAPYREAAHGRAVALFPGEPIRVERVSA